MGPPSQDVPAALLAVVVVLLLSTCGAGATSELQPRGGCWSHGPPVLVRAGGRRR